LLDLRLDGVAPGEGKAKRVVVQVKLPPILPEIPRGADELDESVYRVSVAACAELLVIVPASTRLLMLVAKPFISSVAPAAMVVPEPKKVM